MATITQITGDDASNLIAGSPGPDLIYGYDPASSQTQISAIAAERIATGLTEPLFAASPPGDGTRLFIVGKGGLIQVMDLSTGQIQDAPFLDLSHQIATSGEQGLLGLAFDPNYAQNGRFYLNLTNRDGDTEIRSYRRSQENPNLADGASGQTVIAIDQPDGLTNHKGGWLGFGPDGYLYAALGDGGGAGDPLGNGQDLDSLLGKILRLDVTSDFFPDDPSRNYAIPADNPFATQEGGDEIWAYGLRNPWRDSFDRALGTFHVADVGQGKWEEINLGVAGANYGWNIFEGPERFSPGMPTEGSLTAPIYSYPHPDGEAITGGYVYRGQSEGLQGQYIFADFITGRVWSLRQVDGLWQATDRTDQITPDSGSIDNPVSFGEDNRGDLYLVDFDGDIFRLLPQTAATDRGDEIRAGGDADIIFGGSGNDTLLGQAGADELNGQRGDDRLDGGTEADKLSGGPGGDSFIFAANFGQDVISDFAPTEAEHDILLFSPSLFPDTATLLLASRQAGGDTVITVDTTDRITLHNVLLTSLTPEDFALL